jgi:alpha-ketoglutarate-dependent taurine dioxygenase
MAVTTLEVQPLSGTLGAEVTGVDLADVDDAMWDAVRRAWLEHLVLFFPGQHLAPDSHVALGRRLGEPEVHPYIPKLDDAHPEIVVLDSERGGKADTWHTDVTFSPTPPMASILQVNVSPARGGDTIWTNQYLVYEELSSPLRDLVDGLSAVHTAAPFGHPEITATHPVVRVHPETGRRSLFVNRTFTSHFVELRRSESNALLEYLYRWSEQPQFQCRYRWHEGDVGIWDNRCTQHFAINDYDERRVIQRVTVLGDAPTGGMPKWAPFADGRSGYVTERGAAIETDTRTNSIRPAT